MRGMPHHDLPPILTAFYECGAADAAAQLEPIAAALTVAGAEVEWLSSVDQPGLLLLVARGRAEQLIAPAQEAVRHWRFQSGPS